MPRRTRDGVYNSGLPSRFEPSTFSKAPSTYSTSFSFTKQCCCCIKPTKVKVELPQQQQQQQQQQQPRSTAGSKQSSSSLVLTLSQWAGLVLFILATQLLCNYILLRTTLPPFVLTPPHHTPERLATLTRQPPPRNLFVAEYFATATPTMTTPTIKKIQEKNQFDAVPRVTNTIKAIDFQPPPSQVRTNPSSSMPTTGALFPPHGINSNEFVAVFRGIFLFEAQQYRFVVASSHGVRVWVDNQLILDEFRAMGVNDKDPLNEKMLLTFASKQEHLITVEYIKTKTIKGKDRDGDRVPFSKATEPAWTQVADELLSSHLHVHWVPDQLGLKVYMYDLPLRFNEEIVITNKQCAQGHMFGAELAIHQQLATSIARTKDPREADLFYVPVYSSCKYLGKPFFGIDPWFGKRMVDKSVEYIALEFPYWRKRQGQDHIFAMTYDYGGCFEYKYSKANAAGVLRSIQNAILLSTISDDTVSCFRPSIDIPIPTWIDPQSSMAKPLLPLAPLNSEGDGRGSKTGSGLLPIHWGNGHKNQQYDGPRDWKVYFQGSKEWVIDHDPEYSNGLRNFLFQQYSHDPDFHLNEGKSKLYVSNLHRSVFCLCPRGFAVWSPRVYESVLSGCIPVILADGMHLPFSYQESGVDWRTFSIMIPEEKVKHQGNALKTLLWGVSEQEIYAKQVELRKVRKKMLYSKPLPWMTTKGLKRLKGNGKRSGDENEPLNGDAFEMILRALKEKVRAMKRVSAHHGPGYWL